MNMSADNIVLNSCQYTPVYFIENPGVSQARSYYLAPNVQNAEKPVSESLKRFYENSGKLESNLSTTDIAIKPKNVKKVDTNVVGNNLKLASFLLPKSEAKNEPCQPTITPVNNVLLKPVYIANNRNLNNINNANQVPKIDVNSRLVKLKDLPNIVRSQNGKILPKMKPKESSPSNKLKPTTVPAVQPVQPVQPMPVQLVKFGETYHSLNQLSNDQMLIVNHALKMFNNTQPTPEAAYDPATNTKFIYKVVSQKDFVERNKLNKPVTTEIKKEPVQVEIIEEDKPEIEEDEPKVLEAKVTRSGRVVKLPKSIILDDSPTKPKRKANAVVTCLQCNAKFSSPQRLQRHYENHPSHLPTNLHNYLFQCLVAVVSAGTESERVAIMIQQLEQLIVKLRSCLPCLLKCDSGKENFGVINDEIGKLFGINSGKYNFNIDALNCEKDKDGYCNHNPQPQISVTDNVKPHIKIENIDSSVIKPPSNIIKVNLQDRRPKILRKVECRKQKLEQSSHNVNGKKMKLSLDTSIDKNSNSKEIDDLVALLSDTAKTENNITKVIDDVILNEQKEVKSEIISEKVEKVIKPPHIQFHSAHFDIRSSPIKSTSTVFRKFQINPEKMTKYIEVIRPLQPNQLGEEKMKDSANNVSNMNTHKIFSDTNIITSKESENLTYTTKSWCEEASSFMKPNDLINGHTDNFINSNAVIKPALLHVKNGTESANNIANESVLMNIKNDSEINLLNKVDDLTEFIKSNMFAKELAHEENSSQEQDNTNNTPDFIKELINDSGCQVNNVNNGADFMKSNILIEPLLLAQNNATNNITPDQTNNDFKSDILIDQTLLNAQSKVIGDIHRNDYMESSLIHQNVKVDKFDDQTNNYITSNDYMNTSLQHNNLVNTTNDNGHNDIDDNTNHGQSIISFLESLGNELAYTETDRNNPVDFQLDLFSFNNS